MYIWIESIRSKFVAHICFSSLYELLCFAIRFLTTDNVLLFVLAGIQFVLTSKRPVSVALMYINFSSIRSIAD